MAFPTYEKQEDVPEGFRDDYVEKDGKWVAKIDDGAEVKAALKKEREAHEAAEKARKKLEREFAELKTQLEADKVGLDSEKLKKLRDEIRADIEGEYADKVKDAETLRAEVRTLKLDNQVRTLAASKDGGVRAERLEQWWRQFGDRFDLTDDGKPIVKEHPGTDVTKYIADSLKKEFPELYVGTQAAGGGAAGGSRGGTGAGKLSFDDFAKLTPSEKLRIAREAEAGA